jgi:ribose transport system permease protein
MELRNKKRIRFAEGNVLIILVLIVLALALFNDRFLSYGNISNLLRQTSIIGIISIGVTFVIISGGIDLSVGSVLALSSVITSLLSKAGVPIPIAIALSLVTGILVGALMGVVIFEGSVPPFIATLSGLTILKGIVMLLSGARKIVGLPDALIDFAVYKFLGIPGMALIWILIIIISMIIAGKTIFGRSIFALGSNRESARLSGINIRITTYSVYAFSGFTSALAGILMTARLAGGSPTAGTGYEMDAIAAVVLGGASLSGGIGSISGTVIGTLIIAVIKNGGNLLGINPFVLDIIIGVLILVAVTFDQVQKNR